MRFHVITVFLLLVFTTLRPFSLLAQTQPGDKIIGTWLNEEKDGKIEIYKTASKYYGKIVGAKELYELDGKSLRKDTRNPDAKLRDRALFNLVILTGFEFLDGEWTNGKIYDPKSGKTYSCTMKLKGNKLELRGFVGISLLGRTTVWQRAD